ncbi:MAG: FHA domain-containing protein [Clostridia bacterium]|nr:FHA domain-containing protein [Clostridia bacterium]
MDSALLQFVLDIAHYALPILAGAVLILCFTALLRRQPPSLGRAELVSTEDGEVFPLTTRETAIGSHKSCDLVLDHASVSRLHAVVVCSKNGWFISAVGKENPVSVNEVPVEKRAYLQTGDQIAVGDVTLQFNNR